MAIPDHIANRYESAVLGAARDVYKAHGHIVGKDDLISEAWIIVSDGWEAWQSPGQARTDIRWHLYRAAEKIMKAEGYERRGSRGNQKWVPTVLSKSGLAMAKRYPNVEDDSEDIPLCLQVDWEPMNRATRKRYGRILLNEYPVLCADFMRLDEKTKPCNKAWSEWRPRTERKRASLRVKWARELAVAKWKAFGYGELEAA